MTAACGYVLASSREHPGGKLLHHAWFATRDRLARSHGARPPVSAPASYAAPGKLPTGVFAGRGRVLRLGSRSASWGKHNKWPGCSFRSRAGSTTACSRSTPARSRSRASISISSPSISRGRSSTGWRAARNSTSPSSPAPNSSSASPTSSVPSSPFRCFRRGRFATASSPSTARPASRRPRTSRASGWACRC